MKYRGFFRILLPVVILIVPVYLHAQTQNEANISATEMETMLNADSVPLHRAVHTEGSPYLEEDFYEGTVYLVNGYVSASVPIRYNTYSHSLDFMSRNQVLNIGMENIDSFEYSVDETMRRFTKGFEARGISEEDIVEVLAEGDDAVFIIRHNTNFMEDAATYGVATQQDRYTTTETFYIKAGGEGFNRIQRPNKRRVLRSFPDFRDELEIYADENNLGFSSKEDIARLSHYYNSLID